MSPGDDREQTRRWMMAALDGEISDGDRRQLEHRLAGDEDLRREWERMGRVKEVTRSMTMREPPEEIWDGYWTSTYRRFERGVAWILVSIGAAVLATYGAWKWIEVVLADSGVPLFLRLAILAVAAGGILLLFSVIREKLFTRRHDAYKEIQR